MAIISNGTTVASGGNLQAPRLTGNLPAISGASLTGVTPPTTLGAIGTYGIMRNDGSGNGNNLTPGETISGSWIYYANCHATADTGTTVSGTWRTMGWAGDTDNAAGYGYRTTLFVRIS